MFWVVLPPNREGLAALLVLPKRLEPAPKPVFVEVLVLAVPEIEGYKVKGGNGPAQEKTYRTDSFHFEQIAVAADPHSPQTLQHSASWIRTVNQSELVRQSMRRKVRHLSHSVESAVDPAAVDLAVVEQIVQRDLCSAPVVQRAMMSAAEVVRRTLCSVELRAVRQSLKTSGSIISHMV